MRYVRECAHGLPLGMSRSSEDTLGLHLEESNWRPCPDPTWRTGFVYRPEQDYTPERWDTISRAYERLSPPPNGTSWYYETSLPLSSRLAQSEPSDESSANAKRLTSLMQLGMTASTPSTSSRRPRA